MKRRIILILFLLTPFLINGCGIKTNSQLMKEKEQKADKSFETWKTQLLNPNNKKYYK